MSPRELLNNHEPLSDETRCAYCRFPLGQEPLGRIAYEAEHIIPITVDSSMEFEIRNLVWACRRCNINKSIHVTGFDSLLKTDVTLFHPKRQEWTNHLFGNFDGKIHGSTSTGRGTESRLKFNTEFGPIRARTRGIEEGWWP